MMVVILDQNFCSRTKSSQTLDKYHIKEIRAHSNTELETWTGWAEELTRIGDPPMFYRIFMLETNENFHVMKYVCRTGIKLILVSCKYNLTCFAQLIAIFRTI